MWRNKGRETEAEDVGAGSRPVISFFRLLFYKRIHATIRPIFQNKFCLTKTYYFNSLSFLSITICKA